MQTFQQWNSADAVGLVLEPNAATRIAVSQAFEKLGLKAVVADNVDACVAIVDRTRTSAGPSSGSCGPDDRVVAIVASLEEAAEASPALLDLVEDRVFTPPIVVTVGASFEDTAGRLLRRSVWGVLAKPTSTGEAAAAVSDAIEEGRRRLADRALVRDYHQRESKLNHAERQVLTAVAQGKLNKQIAREMGVSVRTIEQRRRQVFATMDVASAAPLAERLATVRTLERVHAPRRQATPPMGIAFESAPAVQIV